MVAGPGGAAGIQVVNRVLLARLLHDVEQAWRRGWQPAEVWWEHDDHYVTAWGDRQGVDRGTVITLLIEVLRLLATLPAIEVVGPVPGDARPAQASAPADLDQRMLDRVRALLAKAESTDFTEEADAFTAKAQELSSAFALTWTPPNCRASLRDRQELTT
ncbi:DUF2786 domain-containing protein [Actinoplanes toevensis]|uniref:DUF2786 domain-containing protein n=1 Tax=Paractinoplanes toevensis TaxID=571911 RepID=A0A919W693_9ACTN|nr:hypothetical protein Ato02nite_060130 [Actinoplanes toevensis]